MLETFELSHFAGNLTEQIQPSQWTHELQSYFQNMPDNVIRFNKPPQVREVHSGGWGGSGYQVIGGHGKIAQALSIQANSGSKGFWYIEIEVEE